MYVSRADLKVPHRVPQMGLMYVCICALKVPQRCLKYWRSYEGPKVQRSFIVREVADRLSSLVVLVVVASQHGVAELARHIREGLARLHGKGPFPFS